MLVLTEEEWYPDAETCRRSLMGEASAISLESVEWRLECEAGEGQSQETPPPQGDKALLSG